MKKISFLVLFALVIWQAYPQQNNYTLPSEFKDVAARAFEKLSPATKEWFIHTAKQHPGGAFDTSWARKKLKQKFQAGDVNKMGELFMVMIAYQRLMNKEAREDRKISTANRQLVSTNKDKKLKTDNANIEQQKKEAVEKAGKQRDAAAINLWTGIISGTVQTGGAGNNNAGKPNQLIRPVRLYHVDSLSPDTSKLKKKTINQGGEAQQAEKEKEDDEAARKASEDHQKAVKDAIQKLLDQMAGMDREPKL